MTLVVVPKFQFGGFLESIQKYRITHLMVVPPQVLLMCKVGTVPRMQLVIMANSILPTVGAYHEEVRSLWYTGVVVCGFFAYRSVSSFAFTLDCFSLTVRM